MHAAPFLTRPALVLAILSGACSVVVRGPAEVWGITGNNVTVTCRYTIYSQNVKYWCKEAVFRCSVLVQTGGTTNEGRLSIKDNKRENKFSVTMEDLSEQDEGWYRCGILRPGIFTPDEYSLVRITVLQVQAPWSVRGQIKGKVTIRCEYHKSYANHVKYWCKENLLFLCLTLVKTDLPVINDRISIRDDRTEGAVYVTMNDLTEQDVGSYKCGISKPFFDVTASVYVHVNEGETVPDIQGPARVIGQVSTSKNIRCQYSEVYTGSVKYWCKESGVDQCSFIVDTEDKNTENRTQIRDDPPNREFLITIRNLTQRDMGQYHCGVKGPSHPSDKWVRVYLHVDTGTHEISTSSKSLVELFSAPGTTPTTKEEGSTFTMKYPFDGVEKSSTITRLIIFFGVLLLLCGLTAVIACTIKRKARPVVARQSKKLSGALELTYAEVVTKEHTEESGNSLYSNMPFHQAQQQRTLEDKYVIGAALGEFQPVWGDPKHSPPAVTGRRMVLLISK